MRSGPQLRSLFSIILVQCSSARPEVLWERFKESICDDLRYRLTIKFLLETPIDT